MSTSISRTHTHFRAHSRSHQWALARADHEEPTIAAFACAVASELKGIASELSKEFGIKAFCSSLAAALDSVRKHLESLDGGQDNIIAVPELLDNFERLCQWPASSTAKSSVGLTQTLDRRRYPALKRLLEKRQVAKKTIRDCASDPRAKKYRQSFLMLLDRFGRAQKENIGPDISELEPSETLREQQDYQAYIRELYTGLSPRCLCLRDDGPKEITANLRLNGCCAPGEFPDSVNFRIFFLDHPHHHGIDGTCQWQDTQICVLRNKRTRMADDQRGDDSTHAGNLVSMETFCKMITNRTRSQLQLIVSDVGLVLDGPGNLSEGFLLGPSSISLAELIHMVKLPRKMRLLLSYLLAKAVWQYYDSEWMLREWNKDTVHFMFERRLNTPRGIFVNEPFLSAYFDSRPQPQSQNTEFRSHLFPKILSLGIMLLEIELRVRIEDHRMPEDKDPNGQPTVNADHIAAIDALKNADLWDDKGTFDRLKDVIATCLTPEKFKPFKKDVQGLRDALQKHVVNRLYDLYRSSWDDPDNSNIRAVNLDQSSPHLPEPNDETTSPVSPLPANSLIHAPVATPPYQMQHYSYPAHLGASVDSLSPLLSLQ